MRRTSSKPILPPRYDILAQRQSHTYSHPNDTIPRCCPARICSFFPFLSCYFFRSNRSLRFCSRFFYHQVLKFGGILSGPSVTILLVCFYVVVSGYGCCWNLFIFALVSLHLDWRQRWFVSFFPSHPSIHPCYVFTYYQHCIPRNTLCIMRDSLVGFDRFCCLRGG